MTEDSTISLFLDLSLLYFIQKELDEMRACLELWFREVGQK